MESISSRPFLATRASDHELEQLEPEVALDNDVILKSAQYGLTSRFWPKRVGVLGAAPYVLRKAVERGADTTSKESVLERLGEFFNVAAVLEPSEEELRFAAEVELLAQRLGLSLDSGESQLASIVIERRMGGLESGDKRAIRSFEDLLDHVERLDTLCGKVRCLEQIVLRTLARIEFREVSAAICAEPEVDKSLSICFGCYSKPPAECDTAIEGLTSYVDDARTEAPRILAT